MRYVSKSPGCVKCDDTSGGEQDHFFPQSPRKIPTSHLNTLQLFSQPLDVLLGDPAFLPADARPPPILAHLENLNPLALFKS